LQKGEAGAAAGAMAELKRVESDLATRYAHWEELLEIEKNAAA